MTTKPMTKDEVLLPCPFCGGDAVSENFVVEAHVRCLDCGASIKRRHGTHDDNGLPESITAWNRRAAWNVSPSDDVSRKWSHVDNNRRTDAFNVWVRTQAAKAGFRLMPPGYQGQVHGMLRTAFNAGSNWQRRHGDKPQPAALSQLAQQGGESK